MATMKQIAQLAGVSRGTVDRVLNNRGIVSEATAQKVREIAQSLQYVPSRAAKSLAALKHNIHLGYILPSIQRNPFFGQVADGIRKKAAELAEYGVIVDVLYHDFSVPEQQEQLLNEMVEKGVDGIVICGFNTENITKKIRELQELHIPIITVNSDIPNSGRMAYVGSDHIRAGRTAANLMSMITGGNAQVGILLGSHNMHCHSERVKGFLSYIKDFAPGIHVVDILENNDDDFKSFSAVQELLCRTPPIDALFLASAGVYGACRAVELTETAHKPKIISYDCVPSTATMLQKGVISATICQMPEYQGSKPLDILFNYICMGMSPSREYYYTSPEIRIKENL